MRRPALDLSRFPGAVSLGIDLDAIGLATTTDTKPHKYRARKTEYRGLIYDSIGEAEHAAGLDARLERGVIRWWHPKPGTFHLGCPENAFRPDFLVLGTKDIWIEEFKGVETAKFHHDVKLWRAYGPFLMRVFSKSGSRDIIPTRFFFDQR